MAGTIQFAGGANITLSTATAADQVSITISGASGGGTPLSLGVSTGGNTSGNTTVNTGSRFVLVGGNNVTLSQATAAGATTITMSVPNTASQTDQSAIKGLGASNTGNTAGNTGLSTGIDWVLAGSNNITISESTAGGGPNTLWVSGPAVGGAQTGISGISNSETMYTSGTVKLSGTNNVTVFSTTGQAYVVSGANTHAQQTAISGIGNTETTYTSGTVELEGTNNITVFSTTGQRFRISGANTHAQQTGISAVYDGANSVSSGTLRLTNANNITFTLNGQTLSGSVHAPETPLSVGVSTGGNTAGNTTVNTGSRLVFSGQSNITLSQATAAGATTIGISGPDAGAGGNFSGGISNLGNTAGSSGITGTQNVFVATDGATYSQSTGADGATITLDPGPVLNMYYNVTTPPSAATITGSNASWAVFPLVANGPFPGVITANTAYIVLGMSGSTATMSQANTTSLSIAVYTQNGSTLSLLNSASTTFGGAAATNNSTSTVGTRWYTFGTAQWSSLPVFTRGEYYIATAYRTSGVSNQTLVGAMDAVYDVATTFSGTAGVASISGSTLGWRPWYGAYTASSTQTPVSIGSNQLNRLNTGSAHQPVVVLLRTGPQTF